jgi:hypothetical protein
VECRSQSLARSDTANSRSILSLRKIILVEILFFFPILNTEIRNLNKGGDLGTETLSHASLVSNHQATGFAHRLEIKKFK